ncbi:MAG: OmpA family protein [Idiomarina sp.]
MKLNKITQAISALAVLGMAVPAVAADHNGWYVGAGGGVSFATIDEQEIMADLLASGFETTQFDEDDRDFGYKIFAGYQFNQNFALEGGYFDLGEFNYTATTIPAGSNTGELDFSGWNVDLVGLLPLTKRSSLIGRIGLHKGEATVNYSGTGAVNVLNPYYSNTGLDYKIGLGYQYHVNNAVSLRLEVERFRIDDAVGHDSDIDLLSLSAIYRFGAKAEAAVAAPTKAPARTVVATEQYCSALAMQFEIGNENVERVNREHLLVLATFLTKYPETQARIEGHTDSVGSDADNMKLSQQRAQNVVDYLVREHDIAANRLTATGYGETRPLSNNDTDAGQQANRRINAVIDCATDITGLNALPARTTLAMALEFDTDGSKVDPKYHNQLENIAKYLRVHPEIIVTLEGHTDNANPATAQAISQQRARSVADYLVTNFGVERSRLNVEGFGVTRRDTYNITAAERQDNRRVNIILGYRK